MERLPDDKLIIWGNDIYYTNENGITNMSTLFKTNIICGSYIGDGDENRSINLGVTPYCIFLFGEDGASFTNIGGGSTNVTYGGFAFKNHPVYSSLYARYEALSITSNGFSVHNKSSYDLGIYASTNKNDTNNGHQYTYYYFVIY